jgi:[acyl-carrier-protein] S-malonyltransferase
MDQLTTLAADPELKTPVIALPVAGAFHTDHMRPAAVQLESALRGVEVYDPNRTILSNADGAVVANGAEVVRRLLSQVIRPVRWDQCIKTMRALGVSAIVELCPGGTLTGIAKRELPGVKLIAIRTPEDLPPARALIASYAGAICRSDTISASSVRGSL